VRRDQGQGQTYWGENFYFDKKITDPTFFENEKIKITVLNSKRLGFDAVIGFFNIDISSIYSKKDHVLLHQW
jgi:hypothetical protein